MSQDWMINVLLDLREFSARNGLDRLTEQLDDTIHVAVAETTLQTPAQAARTEKHASTDGSVPGTRGAM